MSQDLYLRTLEKDDLEFLHKLQNNPAVMDYWFEEPYASMERMRERFEHKQKNAEHRQFILCSQQDKLGLIGLVRIDQRHRHAEFAIMIDPEQQGNGYALTATQLAMDYAFKVLNLHKLFLHVDKENEKAHHIYEKAGFHADGVMYEHFFVDGSYHDVIEMSMFQREYWEL